MSGTSTPEDTKAEAPGFGMKMTIAGIKAKFSSVSNMATETLATLMSSIAANGEKLDEKTTENLVILVKTSAIELADRGLYLAILARSTSS